MKRLSFLKNSMIALSASNPLSAIMPTAFAVTHGGGGVDAANGAGGRTISGAQASAVSYIVEIIRTLLGVFTAAGIILLAYSIIAFAIAMKDENSESKVNATSQMVVAIVLITFSGTLAVIAKAVNVTI